MINARVEGSFFVRVGLIMQNRRRLKTTASMRGADTIVHYQTDAWLIIKSL